MQGLAALRLHACALGLRAGAIGLCGLGQLPGPDLGRSHRVGEGGDVVHAVVAASVDEERRRAGYPALVRARYILADPRGVLPLSQLLPEALDVQAEIAGVADKIAWPELILVSEKGVVHLPEP